MRIDKEEIKGLRVSEYVEYVFELPLKLYRDLAELATLQSAADRHALTRWRFFSFYSSDENKSEGFIRRFTAYEEAYKEWEAKNKERVEALKESSTEAFYTLALAGIYPTKEAEKIGTREMLDLLEECGVIAWAKGAEDYYKTVLEYHRECLDKRMRFDNKAEERELERLGNKKFEFVGFIIDGNSCAGLFCKDWSIVCKLMDELAELTFYQELATNKEDNEKQEDNNKKTIYQRLALMESLGVFALPAFVIDKYKGGNSVMSICKLLSDILGEKEESIRKAINRNGIAFNKSS